MQSPSLSAPRHVADAAHVAAPPVPATFRVSLSLTGLSLAAGVLVQIFRLKGVHMTWPAGQPYASAIILAPAAAFAALATVPFARARYTGVAFSGALVALGLAIADLTYFASNLHR
jgi:hypothetical protein